MESLTKLLGGTTRVRLLRLFLFNPSERYDRVTAAKRVRATLHTAGRELQFLARLGIIHKKKSTRAGTLAPAGFSVNTEHPLYHPLRDFLLNTITLLPEDLTNILRPAGKIRLIVASGFFMHNWDQRLDLLIVGDKVDDDILAKAIRSYEVEAGRELSYACLSSEDFYYRSSIKDRLIRDVFDYPHLVLLDKIDIG